MSSGVSPPPGPIAQAPPAAGAHGLATGTIPDPPAALARLADGTVIAGTVIGRDTATGQVTVKTTLGVLALMIDVPLPAGSQVSLEIRGAGDRLMATLLSAKPPPEAAAGLARAGATPPPGTAAPALQLEALSPTIGGRIVTATVVDPTVLRRLSRQAPMVPARANPDTLPSSGSPSPPAGPAQPRPLGQGGVGQGGVGSGGVAIGNGPLPAAPPSANAPASRALATGALATGAPAVGIPATGSPASANGDPAVSRPAAPFLAGSELKLRIVEIVPPATAQVPAARAPVPPSPMLVGTVTAVTPAGAPVVETARGVLVPDIKTPPLPVGSRIVLEALSVPQPAVPPPIAPLIAPSIAIDALRGLALSWEWPTLADAVAVLSHSEPGTPPAPSTLPLPQAGPRLAAGLLTLIAAFGGGDLAGTLGAALGKSLERRGHGDLAGRVRQDLAQVMHLAADTPDSDWRLLLLPLLDGSALQKVKLYLRRHPRESDAPDRRDGGTRFIFEVELTRLGPLQLDGLVRTRRFDLMLRSRTPLTPRMRQDIADIFDEARAISGLAGRIEFATAATLPAIPLGRDMQKGGDLLA